MYMEDLKILALDGYVQKVATLSETVKEKEFEETRKLWDRAFNQPYEKAGGEVSFTLEGVISIKSLIPWEESDTDVNTKYRSMLPRFLLEVIFMLSYSYPLLLLSFLLYLLECCVLGLLFLFFSLFVNDLEIVFVLNVRRHHHQPGCNNSRIL